MKDFRHNDLDEKHEDCLTEGVVVAVSDTNQRMFAKTLRRNQTRQYYFHFSNITSIAHLIIVVCQPT